MLPILEKYKRKYDALCAVSVGGMPTAGQQITNGLDVHTIEHELMQAGYKEPIAQSMVRQLMENI